MKAAIYDATSGEIRCVIIAPLSIIQHNCQGGESYLSLPKGASVVGKKVEDGQLVDDPDYVPAG